MTKEEFIEQLKELNIELTNKQLEQLEKFYTILVEQNKYLNLTAITKKEEVYLKHFYDSLTLTKAIDLNNQTLCDIGSGAGFPGIVLKIAYPNLKITLIDALQKRVNFLNQVIEALSLEQIEAIHARIEDYSKQNEEKFDIITSRAVAKTNTLLEISAKSLKINGNIILMKANIEEELKTIDKALKELNLEKKQIITFTLPKENSLRNLINITKNKKTPTKYPRDFTKIKNNPL